MFTGIIQQIGIIGSVTIKEGLKTYAILTEHSFLDACNIADSIAVSGICSTITQKQQNMFFIEHMESTLSTTTSRNWEKGGYVNLEHPLTLSDKLNGHFVLGHIDEVIKITDITDHPEFATIRFSIPDRLKKYIALKGSVTLDGVGLTVSHLLGDSFEVSLIPYTKQHTTFKYKKTGDEVNIEIDMISRYLKQLFDERDKESSYEFLKERGFI